MGVSARRRNRYAHALTARDHVLIADEPPSAGGTDLGPTPQELLALSLAACTAVTLEMYAERKGWDVGALEVDVDYETDRKGACSRFDVILRLPAALEPEQVERLKEIAGRCPVHRTLACNAEIVEHVETV